MIGGPSTEIRYVAPVSYGIRRCEFDHYLLTRCGARLFPGVPLTNLTRIGEYWIANEQLRARLVVGAGGHFCPVARHINPRPGRETALVAQETEFEMNRQQLAECRVQPDTPELYSCPDAKGYGWCFRKRNYLNVGLGRMDPHHLTEHVAGFLNFLCSSGRFSFALPTPLRGHAYHLYGRSSRTLIADAVLLVGDAASLAYSQSGEGILPSIQSGLLAAETIREAAGRYGREQLRPYLNALQVKFGESREPWYVRLGRHLPPTAIRVLARRLLATSWFARDIVLDRWFLHAR
jgi:menaquinone-9 beta-reductase